MKEGRKKRWENERKLDFFPAILLEAPHFPHLHDYIHVLHIIYVQNGNLVGCMFSDTYVILLHM